MKVAEQSVEDPGYRVIVGLGATGLSCARYLSRIGLPFAVVDSRATPPGLGELKAEMPEVQFYGGIFPLEVMTGAAELVVSPGVRLDDPGLLEVSHRGVSLVGDIDLFMREAQAPVIGITGSNGKSTVTELVGQMAIDAGLDAGVGGNLGTPALDLLSVDRELYVLELSSFQLERAGQLGLTVATVLNVSADHLDRHGSLANYRQAKHRIFQACETVVTNPDDAVTVPLKGPSTARVAWRMGVPGADEFGLGVCGSQDYLMFAEQPLLPLQDLGLVGLHNVANVLAALALGHAAGLPLASMITTVRHFRGLPHRSEQVAELSGVRYINDSKGTNTGATEAALRGLGGDRDVLLIAGGQGKGADFTELQAAVAKHCKLVVAIGEDAAAIEQALSGSALVVCAGSMEEAFAVASGRADHGDTVLLSPACASFDMFSGYAERGDVFRGLVKRRQEGSA